jgi:flagellar M-ring protein FliF
MDPQQIMARLRALASSFSTAQLVSLALAFVLVVGIVAGSARWVSTPTYALLFSDMDPETASGIVARLKTMKVDYQLDDGGRSLRVPIDKVDELRLEMTSQGMPGSGRVGFELFDQTAFGATEFLEQVNYRRALEGEIARTISTLSEVSSARVHIAMGKDSLFGESRPAKASVVLKLRGQRTLPASTAQGIGNLVAASVEGLRPDAVVIIDSYGRPLSRPTPDDTVLAGARQFEKQQHLEHEMAARVVALLEPVVGTERVRVNVALRLNPSTVEQTEERFDPATVVRSRQVTADTSSSNTVGGLAGARGNMPPPAPDPKNPTPPEPPQLLAGGVGASRTAETTNYEVSRTMVVTQKPPGDIARVSVAVIVDDEHVVNRGENGQVAVTRRARTGEELQKIHGLVAAAVGLETDRGDQITVQNISFEEPVVEEAPALTTLEQVQQYGPQIWEGVRILLVAIIGLVALLLFVRPLMQSVGSRALAPPVSGVMLPNGEGPLHTVAELEQQIEAQLAASAAQKADSRRLPVLARHVSAMSAKEPENVAKLLRGWIAEGER